MSQFGNNCVEFGDTVVAPVTKSDGLLKRFSEITLCLKNVPTVKLSVTLSNLDRFSKFAHAGKH